MRQRTERTNIVFVLTDDQGYGDIAALGNPIVSTPNLDPAARREGSVHRLARELNVRTHPVALKTGKHEFKSGVTIASASESK